MGYYLHGLPIAAEKFRGDKRETDKLTEKEEKKKQN